MPYPSPKVVLENGNYESMHLISHGMQMSPEAVGNIWIHASLTCLG